MSKPGKTAKSKAKKRAVKDLSPDKAAKVTGGRGDRQLNSGGVNPIVISRDRALIG